MSNSTFAVWARFNCNGSPSMHACLLRVPEYVTFCGQDWNPMVSPHVEHLAYYQPVAVPEPNGKCFNCLAVSWTFAQQGSLCILQALSPYGEPIAPQLTFEEGVIG